MESSQETFALWATILGTAIRVIGLIESRSWLTGLSVALLAAAVFAVFYARKKRGQLDSASVGVEGRSIDSLNLANLRRRLNRSLVIQEAHHEAEIKGEDITMRWSYAGYCRGSRETAKYTPEAP